MSIKLFKKKGMRIGMLKNKWLLFLLFSITLLTTIFTFKGFCGEGSNTARENNMQQINLSIRPTKEEFELNTPISMEVIFENKSDKPLFLNGLFNVLQCGLQFDITMPSGDIPQEAFILFGKSGPLSKKDFIKIRKEAFIKIQKGKAFREIIDISKRHVLYQRGKYVVSVTYFNYETGDELQIKAWTGSAKSNVGTFTVK